MISKPPRTNTNSVFSKFRCELDKNYEYIDKEIQKSKELKRKFNEFKQIQKIKDQELNRIKYDFNNHSEQSINRSLEQINGSNLFDTQIPVIPKNNTQSVRLNRKSETKTGTRISVNKSSGNKKFSYTESNNINNPNSKHTEQNRNSNILTLLEMNMSGNKSKSNTTPTVQETYRKSHFNVAYMASWYDKTGLPTPSFSPFLLKTVDYQSSIVNDEIKVLMDNLQYLKTNYLSNYNMINIFRNMETQLQIKFNKCLEESCGLLMMIPNMILLDFSKYIEKFIAINPPSESRMKSRQVKCEEKAFVLNCRLLSDINLFIKSVIEVYTLLVKQVDDMIISHSNFGHLIQFLSRSRYNISYMISTSKNSFVNMKNDLKSFNKYMNSIRRNEELQNVENSIGGNKRKPPLPKINPKKNEAFNRVDISEKIKRDFMFKSADNTEKIARLNIILSNKESSASESYDKKRKFNKKIGHESALVCS